MNAFRRGSEWRLWDLHIHTPASFNFSGPRFQDMDAAGRESTISRIIQNINESNVAAYAINDYWTFDGYLALRAANAAGEAIQKTILPGIELRVESATKHRMNIHVIFSDEVTDQELSDFKSALRIKVIGRSLSDEALRHFARELGPDKARQHGATADYLEQPEQLLRIGSESAEITRASFEEALNLIPRHKHLVMIPYNCYGGMATVDWKVHEAEDIYWLRCADIVEERRREHIQLFGGQRTEQNQDFIENFQHALGDRPKPCVSGSDGHSVESFRNWRAETARKKTWIKADPTFEGLRQILFEPTARVRIQETSPELEYSKPFLGSINIAAETSPFPPSDRYENPRFAANLELPLNRDLVCIIGGRGTGKSCLVGYLGSAFGRSDEKSFFHPSSEFSVIFNKDLSNTVTHRADEGAQLPFVYISQNEVKSKIQTGSVGAEIKRMLGVEELSFSPKIDSQILSLRRNVSELED